MTARVVLWKASEAQWLAHRMRGIGGSEAAIILGHNPWTTPHQLWQLKTGRWVDSETRERYAVRRGHYMEPWLLAEYVRRNPGCVMERPPALLAHPDHPRALASLDGLAHHPEETVLVECKTANARLSRDWWDPAVQIPNHYLIQVLWYLAVCGLDTAHVVADLGGDWEQLEIPRDPGFEEWAIPMCVEWFDRHVAADEAPPVDFLRDDIPTIARTWATEPGEVIEATPAALGAVKVAGWVRGRISEQEALHGRLRAQIRHHMGTAQAMTHDGRKVASIDRRGVLTVRPPKEAEESQ